MGFVLPPVVSDALKADGSISALHKFMTSDASTEVSVPVYGNIPSLQGYISTMFENGGLPATPFETKSLMTASAKPDGTYAVVTNDNIASNVGVYLKKSGVWSFVPWNTTRLISDLRTAFSLNTPYLDNNILNDKGFIKDEWFMPPNAKYFEVLRAVKSIRLYNSNPLKTYRLTVFANSDPAYKDKITITEDGASILDYGTKDIIKNPDGLTVVKIVAASNADNRSLSAELVIDYSELSIGTLLASSASPIIIKINQPSPEPKTILPPVNKRISMAGSSITWGDGYLASQSYLSVVERYLRDVVATTIHINDLAPNDYLLSGENWYKGNARRLNGAGKYVEFDIYGDELSICYGLERGNNNSALIDVIIDGQLYDTFDTSNTLPSGTKTENFTGDGSTVKFNLTTAHSYAHTVKVNGVTKSGSMNVGGSGASVTQDYLVVRSYDNNSEQVVHTVWFKVAPPSGASVTVDFSYGESISYTKWTVGNTGRGFTAPLESQYGDGATSYSTTEPAKVSSGLGFRQTDERSVKTYRFDNAKIRHVKLLVKAISPLAVATTPFFDLNFVTNRMHHLQNAGIGGWTAQLLLDSSVKINRADYVARFNPDIFLLESATNDDWNTHVATATVTRTMTDADILKADTSLYYSAISGNTVTDERVNIVAITSTTIKLESAVNDASINVGDAITIGSYGGDHRRIATRTVKSYDTSNKTVTLNRMIDADDFRQITALSELVGSFVLIKNAPTWANSVEQVCSVVLDGNPDCKVYLTTAGIPNYYHRRLFGYRELAKQLILKNGYAGFADFYRATFDFQYNQAPKKSITFTATSSKRYKVSLGGRVPCVLSVTVAGVQRTDYKITGGYGYQWDVTSNPTLANDVLKIRDFYIEFDNAVSGSVVVNYTSDLWSADYTHPLNINGLTDGIGIIGREVVDTIATEITP